ncbi:TadE family protein [Streptomyces sp. C10-9-1]|uniref:TadE family protein n=1 Tax=Streptomyces sp. C10-9-1 TaxID=1859285 RepID=UPI003D72292B
MRPPCGPEQPERPEHPERRRTRRDERGQAALEYVGVITVLLFTALAAIQLGLVAYAAQQAGTASRAAARAAAYEGVDIGPEAAGRRALSGWLDGEFAASYGEEEVSVTARVRVPALLPLLDFGTAQRTTTMPRD